MSDLKENRPAERLKPSREEAARYVLACALAVLVLTYVIALVTGRIPQNGRIDLSTIVLLILTGFGFATLINPGTRNSLGETLRRVRIFQFASMKVELAEIRAQQMDQGAKLEILGLLLPLVITDAERKHLKNLYREKTANYKGNTNLRAELRRLRYLTLIENPGGPIGSITDGKTFDLKDVIQLTPLGRLWAQRIEELPKDILSTDAEMPREAGTAVTPHPI
jgi:hypothetical protein